MDTPISRRRISSRSKVPSPLEQSFYGQFVRELIRMRKAQGMTQEELNGRLGITDGLLAKWETFQSLPGAFMLMTWCMALGARLTPIAERMEDEACHSLETEGVPVRRERPRLQP